MATIADASELEKALGEMSETVVVTVGGKPREVTIRPFRLRQFSRVLKCVQRLRDCGVIEEKTLRAVADADDAQAAAKSFDMVKMFLEGGDEVINIIQIAVDGQLQAHEVNNLSLPDGARLGSSTFALNVDFFYQNKQALVEAFSPAVKAVEAVMQGGLEALGGPPLTDLGEQDTA